jgi:membrane protein
MSNSDREKRELAGRFALSRRQLSESTKSVQQAFDLGRYTYCLQRLVRENIYAWMTSTAVVGWVLSRIPAKKQEFYLPSGKHQKRSIPKGLEGQNAKSNSKILTLGFELLAAVGLSFLKRNLKSWRRVFAKRKSRAQKQTTGRRTLSVSEHGARIDPLDGGDKKAARKPSASKSYMARVLDLFKESAEKWIQDKCPQLGAALAYYTVFSLAPLVLVLLAIFGLIFGSSEQAREKITDQLRYFIDPSGVKVIQDIATNASSPKGGILATAIGIMVGVFGASGVFGQLQDALNTIWEVKPKPEGGIWAFVRARFLSFAMVGGICFLLLVSLTVESLIQGFGRYFQSMFPGGHFLALAVFFLFDLAVILLLFAMIFRYLPDARIAWHDVWIGAALTTVLFAIGKLALGLYLGSGAAGSAYGAASSLITLLLWIFYSAQIMLFGAEFTRVYADSYGSHVEPEHYAVKVQRQEIEVPSDPP